MATGNPSDSLSSSRSDWNVESLQAEAYRLLQEFRSAAATHGATEAERINADTAKILVEIAEKKARLIDRRAADSKIEELENIGAQLIKSLERDIGAGLMKAGKGSESASVAQLQRESLEKLQAHHKEIVESLDQHAWNAWTEVCEELFALRAGRARTNKTGEA